MTAKSLEIPESNPILYAVIIPVVISIALFLVLLLAFFYKKRLGTKMRTKFHFIARNQELVNAESFENLHESILKSNKMQKSQDNDLGPMGESANVNPLPTTIFY